MIVQVFKELSEQISSHEHVQWVDLWYNQTDYETDGYPWPTDAVFLEIRSDQMESMSEGVQDLTVSVTFYYVHATLADTHRGSINQDAALQFGERLEQLHALLQEFSGTYIQSLNRTSIAPIPTANFTLINYAQTYIGRVTDATASKEYDTVNDLSPAAEVGDAPEQPQYEGDNRFTP